MSSVALLPPFHTLHHMPFLPVLIPTSSVLQTHGNAEDTPLPGRRPEFKVAIVVSFLISHRLPSSPCPETLWLVRAHPCILLSLVTCLEPTLNLSRPIVCFAGNTSMVPCAWSSLRTQALELLRNCIFHIGPASTSPRSTVASSSFSVSCTFPPPFPSSV